MQTYLSCPLFVHDKTAVPPNDNFVRQFNTFAWLGFHCLSHRARKNRSVLHRPHILALRAQGRKKILLRKKLCPGFELVGRAVFGGFLVMLFFGRGVGYFPWLSGCEFRESVS